MGTKKNNNDSTDTLKISNAESFNKFVTTLSTAYIPGLVYLIRHQIGNTFWLKVSAWMFVIALIFTLIALYIGSEHQYYEGPWGLAMKYLDLIALVLFIASIFVLSVLFLT